MVEFAIVSMYPRRLLKLPDNVPVRLLLLSSNTCSRGRSYIHDGIGPCRSFFPSRSTWRDDSFAASNVVGMTPSKLFPVKSNRDSWLPPLVVLRVASDANKSPIIKLLRAETDCNLLMLLISRVNCPTKFSSNSSVLKE